MSIFELIAILEDSRMQVIGGLIGVLEVYEMAIIPSLMNNCGTWTEISEQGIEELEGLQNLFFRMLFQVPTSTPKSFFCWETKTLTMRLRIWKEKLNLYKYLQHMPEETLANEIFMEQKRCGFPGLVKECEEFAKVLGIENQLTDIKTSKAEFKRIVKTAINMENEKVLRNQLKNYSKVKEWADEDYGIKDYLKNMTLEDSRMYFRIRCNMTKFAFNFRNMKEYSDTLWWCSSCEKAVDTFAHSKWCIAHSDLRQGKDLSDEKDLVKYITEVLLRREKDKLQKLKRGNA